MGALCSSPRNSTQNLKLSRSTEERLCYRLNALKTAEQKSSSHLKSYAGQNFFKIKQEPNANLKQNNLNNCFSRAKNSKISIIWKNTAETSNQTIFPLINICSVTVNRAQLKSTSKFSIPSTKHFPKQPRQI